MQANQLKKRISNFHHLANGCGIIFREQILHEYICGIDLKQIFCVAQSLACQWPHQQRLEGTCHSNLY